MSLEVTFDSNGLKRFEFVELRDKLIGKGSQFTPAILRFVPYEQLALCATGEAEAARCSIDLVRQEKRERRRRFLHTPTHDLAAVKRYIQAEGMFSEVHYDRQLLKAVHWVSLSYLQRAWYRLTCLHNHIDDPMRRLYDARKLIFAAGDSGAIPFYTATGYLDAIDNLVERYPRELGTEDFRTMIGGYAEEVLQLMTPAEREVCLRELVSDYVCSSDCFQPTLSTTATR